MKEMIKAGVAKTDITPAVGCYLQGHSARNKPSEKVHDPLYIKVLSLNDGTKRVLMISADLIGFSEGFVSGLEKALKKENIEPKMCFLSASHTHTGPFILDVNLWTRFDGQKFQQSYLDWLREKIVETCKDAISKEKDSEIGYCKNIVDIGIINRRRKNESGWIEMAPNPDGSRDCEISVLTFQHNKEIFTILFNYSCHPTTISPEINEISADYPGVAQKTIEDYFGCIALFTNGFCGDVRPAIIENGRFKGGDFKDVERMGKILGNKVIGMVEKSQRLAVDRIEFKKEKIKIPFDRKYLFKSIEDLEEKYAEYPINTTNEKNFKIWKEYWIEKLKKGETVSQDIPCDISILKIGDVKIIGIGGEVAVEYGLKIKEKEKNAIVVGYCGVDIGYIPTKSIIEEGGYEGEVFLLYGYPARFSTEIENIILNYIFSNI